MSPSMFADLYKCAILMRGAGPGPSGAVGTPRPALNALRLYDDTERSPRGLRCGELLRS